ncbi:MAG: ABC transporter permease [Chloroflexota bacterium]
MLTTGRLPAATVEPASTGGGSVLADLPYPVRAIARRWRGMVGMVLGVGLALGIGMALLGVSNASLDLYTRDYRLSGADLRVITHGGTLVPLLPSDSPGTVKHATSTLSQIRGLPNVAEAVGMISWELERERPGQQRSDLPAELVAVMGIDGDPERIPGTVVLDQGRWLRRGDELVVGPRLSREKQIRLGQSLRLAGRDFQVVGIGKLRGFTFQGDSVAYLERRSLRQRAEVGDLVSMILVDTTTVDATRARIEELDSLAVYDVTQTIQLAEDAVASDRLGHWIMTTLTLAIAALFVNNMMSGSVEARRLELATQRAIGIPNRTILLTIAGEVLLVCSAAWVVGVGVSTLLGWYINAYMAPAFGQESFYAADATLFLTVFGLALGLGLVAGLGPARRATGVNPVEVLREA